MVAAIFKGHSNVTIDAKTGYTALFQEVIFNCGTA